MTKSKSYKENIFKHRTTRGILAQIADKEDPLHSEKNPYKTPANIL